MPIRTAKSLAALFALLFITSCQESGVGPMNLTFTPYPVFNSVTTRFMLTDSAGVERTSFQVGEKMKFSYVAVNSTMLELAWTTGMSNPFAHFTVSQAGVVKRDSYNGLAFMAVIIERWVQPGDSLIARWTLPSAQEPEPLPAGNYVAAASPDFIFELLGVPPDEKLEFSVVP